MGTLTEDVTVRPHAGPQTQFLASPADVCIYGGAAGGGKTWALLLEPLRHVHVPDFGAVILRRTQTQVRNQGGLWDESEGIYPDVGATARQYVLEWTFRSGARVKFGSLEHEQSKYEWQGAQIPLIGFDELTHFSETQFWYLLSRNRSTSGVRPYVRATCNPDADSWVADLIAWWIDQETGFAIPERAGAVRWFVRSDGALAWADDPRTLREQYPGSRPKSLSFVPATLRDNPTLCHANPDYAANLDALGRVDRARLRDGNWKITATDGAEWEDRPEYFEGLLTDAWPETLELGAMALDGSKGGKSTSSDYSAIVYVGMCSGALWVRADIAKRSAEPIVRDLVWNATTLQPHVVAIEANGFQHLFEPLIDRECERIGLPSLPMVLIHNSADKRDRIRTLEPYLSRRKLRVYDDAGGRLLVQQLRGFPVADHDDGPDALEMALRVLSRVAAGTLEEV